MGLAASQARFLAITSRKMNCEFQSMQIAQEKLSITRDLQKAAEEYQNSLNATKLVWDSGDGDIYDLTYDVMTTPSSLNGFQPFLITDAQGKLVLSTKMFNAALAAGVINEKGDPIKTAIFNMGSTSTTDGSRNAFLYQLGFQGVISSSTINSIVGLGENGYTLTGAGGEVADKTLANVINTNMFISKLKDDVYQENVTTEDKTEIIHHEGDKIYSLDLTTILTGSTFCDTTSPNSALADGTIIVTKGDTALSEEEIKELTLGDLLSGEYALTLKEGTDDSKIEKIAQTILDEISDLLGINAGNDTQGLNTDAMAQQALNNAYDFTINNLRLSSASVTAGGFSSHIAITNTYNAANDANCIAKGNGYYSVSLTNMLKTFLTQFAIALDGYDSGYSIDADSSKDSLYVTDDPGYYFALANNDEGTMNSQDMLNADFYNQIYNQICMNGATTDTNKMERVNDPEYLTHALKNGQLFVAALNEDGYFYQTNYNTFNSYVSEVTDDDAIARAEAEYNVVKSKLNSKEESLEIKMKNIDTELSALTTEYDTVKNLISKNVEKVFTMFST